MVCNQELPSTVCARVKKLGYERSQRVRMYGEEFEIISEPFVVGNGIAVRALTRASSEVRVLRLPLMLLREFTEELDARAA
jgi:hypothetical protein